jgi:hypothetical protein
LSGCGFQEEIESSLTKSAIHDVLRNFTQSLFVGSVFGSLPDSKVAALI